MVLHSHLTVARIIGAYPALPMLVSLARGVDPAVELRIVVKRVTLEFAEMYHRFSSLDTAGNAVVRANAVFNVAFEQARQYEDYFDRFACAVKMHAQPEGYYAHLAGSCLVHAYGLLAISAAEHVDFEDEIVAAWLGIVTRS